MRRSAAILALVLIACEQQPAGEPVMRAEIGKTTNETANARPVEPKEVASACKATDFEGVLLTHCVADPVKHSIRMALAAEDGPPHGSLRAYREGLGAGAAAVVFAMNGGMFDGEGVPIGYYVENGNRLKELNRSEGAGDFFLRPNGVFFGSDGKWEIRAADNFYSNVEQRPQFGTQSGPMLVIEGQLHPELTEEDPSKIIRNAVGVDADGRAHFVISQVPVSFGLLARYFRDELGTPNALSLNARSSALWDPATERLDPAAPLGPLIIVSKRE